MQPRGQGPCELRLNDLMLTGLGYEAAALMAAGAWAISSVIVAAPSKVMGGPRLTRVRMLFVTAALAIITTALGTWDTIEGTDWILLSLSGLVGLAIGDAALFTAFARLGPRRTSILFTTNAPMVALVSVLFFDERFTLRSGTGAVLVLLGVVLAIAFGTRADQTHQWEEVVGPMWKAVGFGLLGAAGQAGGIILADPAFDGTLDPWAGATIRAVVGTIGLWMLRPVFRRIRPSVRVKLSPLLWIQVIASGLIAMALGKTLVLIALSGGDPGIVAVLISTTPVLQLPLLWAVMRERPAVGAWIGALLAAVGTGLIVI